MIVKVNAIEERLVDTLDRVLDKGIVVDAWVEISTSGIFPLLEPVQRVLIESISLQPYGERPLESDELANLFPYWRRDLWSK